jgi:hypothetical protein
MKVLEGTTLGDRGFPPEGGQYPKGRLRMEKGVRVEVAVREEEGLQREVSKKQ